MRQRKRTGPILRLGETVKSGQNSKSCNRHTD